MSASWSDIKPWVSKLAPMLGAALGGPLGGAAGALIGNALGIKDATPQSIQDAIKTGTLDADHIIALKVAEQDYALKMAEMGYNSVKDLEDIAFKDRDSARKMQMETKSNLPAILAVTVTIGFFGLLFFMMKYNIPEANRDVLNIMLGSLGSAWLMVMTFFFGSTASSARKTEIISKAQPVLEDTMTPTAQ